MPPLMHPDTRPLAVGDRPSAESVPRTAESADWSEQVRARGIAFAVLLTAAIVAFGSLLVSFAARWAAEPQYSHGFIVPLPAAWLAWYRLKQKPPRTVRSSWCGLVLIAGALGARIAADYFFIEFADAAAFILCITGVVLLVWGTSVLRSVWPAVAFLAFLCPLPWTIERLLSAPLQLMGASEAAWYTRLFGIPAIAQGNMIHLPGTSLGVAEACSGLRMLTVFVAISFFAAIVSRRPLWERLLILLSAIPIAVVCNVGRIVAAAVAYERLGAEWADRIFHDLSGWLMMPAAMLLLWLLMKTLDWVFVSQSTASPELVPAAGKRVASAGGRATRLTSLFGGPTT